MSGQSVSRRTYLATIGAAAATGLAGCPAGASETVTVLSAGSLAQTFDDHVAPVFERETGTTVYGEYYGSNAVMRMIEDRTQNPDVVVSADATLLRDRLYDTFTDWDVEFAANSLGLAYDDGTPLGRRLDAGEPWYEVVRDAEDGEVAISDPDLDPLGYRAVQAFELAEREHGIDGFREDVLATAYREPEEPQLLAGVATGTCAAAVVYRNMAVDHDLPFVGFPEEYDFSNPALADHYATVSYTTDEGYTATGRPILYNATVLDSADNPDAGTELITFLIDNPDILEAAGLRVAPSLPDAHGSVPEAISV